MRSYKHACVLFPKNGRRVGPFVQKRAGRVQEVIDDGSKVLRTTLSRGKPSLNKTLVVGRQIKEVGGG